MSPGSTPRSDDDHVTRVPVLICGGGPVGLGVAIELGWRGVPCLLVEQGDGKRIQPKILVVSMRTMEFCRRWGIDDKVRNWGFPPDFCLDNVFVTDLNGFEIARIPMPTMGAVRPPPESPEAQRYCPQTWFDPILRAEAESLPGVTLRHGVKMESFAEDADGVSAVLEDQETGARETVRADYLVACDGYHSGVREALGIDMPGRVLGKSVNLMLRFDDLSALHDKGDAGRYVTIGEEGTYSTFVVIDGRGLWRLTLVGRDGFDPYVADYPAWIRRVLGRDAEYEIAAIEKWNRRAMVAERYGTDRVFLAGDAVHALPPNGGFGMNTGMGDAVDLGWKLAAMHAGWGGAGLMASYEPERRPAGKRAVDEAARNYDRLTSDTRYPGIAADTQEGAALRTALGARLEEANKKAWEPIGIHLGYRYDASPIVIPDGTPPPDDDEVRYQPTARPGSRAPHLQLADGRSILDLYGRHFTLLCLDGDTEAGAPLRAAAASRGMPLDVVALDDAAVRELYAQPLVLVRPDGHVAWRGERFDSGPDTIVDIVRGARARDSGSA